MENYPNIETDQISEKERILKEQYEITHNNSYTSNVADKPAKQIKPFGRAALIITVIICMVFSAGIGSLAGSMSAKKILESNESEPTAIMYESVIRNVSSEKDSDAQLTREQVVALTENSVVEIRTEVMTTGTFMSQYITEGAGSGVVISENGYIATNNHVISGATKITVTLKNGQSYEATLSATDEEADIAVLKIEADNLQSVIFADSDTLTVGQDVVIIGNPLGELGGSVTSGILSAMDREITVEGQIMTLLQTDAAVNPGNSGGGLFNMYGELIGIVNAKSTGEEIDGLGFAIPSNKAKSAISDLLTYGYIKGRVRLGISMVDVTSQTHALYYGVNEVGVYVYSVNDKSTGSLASDMGIKRGDKIISINGTEIHSAAQVSTLIKTLQVGDSVNIVIKRNSNEMTLSATAKEYVPVS